MKFEVIDALAQRLRNSSIAFCEYEEGGAVVRMRFAGAAQIGLGARSEPATAAGATAPVGGREAIQARAAGILRSGHPCSGCAPANPGDTVAQGDIVCFLQVGEVLSAVTAHRAGTLGERLLPDGALVGHGENVMAIT